jgi:hypothetical protein
MILPRDVSVVVQGPYHSDLTPRCLDSISAVLPGAEVILSVWRTGPMPPVELPVTTVVLNDDPGAVDLRGVLSPEVERRTNIAVTNVNRQIVSARNGIKLATRPYVLKLRTDMTVEDAGFLDVFERFRGVSGPLRVFGERIVATNARSPHRSYAFFVQDFTYFGTAEDMRLLWDCPLIPERAALLDLSLEEREARVLVPEQHFVLSALRHRYDIPLKNALHSTPEIRETAERAIAGNFACVDIRRFGVRTLKPSLGWVNEPGEIRYTWLWILKASTAEFLSWCDRHCGGSAAPLIASLGEEYGRDLAEVREKAELIFESGGLDPERLFSQGVRAQDEGRTDEAFNAYFTLLRAGYSNPCLDESLSRLGVDPAQLRG